MVNKDYSEKFIVYDKKGRIVDVFNSFSELPPREGKYKKYTLIKATKENIDIMQDLFFEENSKEEERIKKEHIKLNANM